MIESELHPDCPSCLRPLGRRYVAVDALATADLYVECQEAIFTMGLSLSQAQKLVTHIVAIASSEEREP